MHVQVNHREEIAALTTGCKSKAFQTNLSAGLYTCRNLNLLFAFRRVHTLAGTEKSFGDLEIQRHFDVIAIAFEFRMIEHVDHQKEIASRPALARGSAASRNTEFGAGFHAFGNLHGQRMLGSITKAKRYRLFNAVKGIHKTDRGWVFHILAFDRALAESTCAATTLATTEEA